LPALTEHDLVDGGLVDVCGLLCARFAGSSTDDTKVNNADIPPPLRAGPLVEVATTKQNLHSLALAMTLKLPVLLEGTTGAGKTSLVRHFAARCGVAPAAVLTVQMGDQTDAKALLGSYLSTDTPGRFHYQPGVLVEAVTKGCWLVVEDIDLAPLDVVSLLLPLLENRRLFVPGRGEELVAADSFQLFATRRWQSDRGHRAATNATLLEHLWTRVVVSPPAPAELADIVVHLHPVLQPLVDRIMLVYARLTAPPPPGTAAPAGGHRVISPRDLFKWCTRIAARPEATTLVTALQEALDCFCAALPAAAARAELAAKMALAFDIPADALHALLTTHQPVIHVDVASAAIGRALLPCIPASLAASAASAQGTGIYALTRSAKCLLEQLAVCVSLDEPVLLVGETGTGKTTAVQHLAALLGRPYTVVNMSQQSDSADLLGGFKPVNLKTVVKPALEQFEILFFKTFSRKQNAAFVERVRALFMANKHPQVLAAFQNTFAMVRDRFAALAVQAEAEAPDGSGGSSNNTNNAVVEDAVNEDAIIEDAAGNDAPRKKKKKSPQQQQQQQQALQQQWLELEALASRLAVQVAGGCSFAFTEGALLKAATHGGWILLDELNLATGETLECLNNLLEGSRSGNTVILTERGDMEPIKIHADFRVFACMNPATDVGKRDLPPGIRNRFTEFYVDEMSDATDLAQLVQTYLARLGGSPLPSDMSTRVVGFYQQVKQLTTTRALRDANNHSPHYSLRTLCRGLMHAERMVSQCAPQYALYEGLCMSFQTQLDPASYGAVAQACARHLNGTGSTVAPVHRPRPEMPGCVRVCDLWLPCGPLEPVEPAHYIMTPSVETNLRHLTRVVASGRFPVLLQGPTSAGKTSIIEYLAARTGHRFVRINNHEHTDIQEYIGSYVSTEQGELVFHEGALVEAVRNGYWLVLDELNLAPTDVLEALNRLLDDNRELFIHETQEVVRPHKDFMLFATQNPPLQYGGRKVLSRAFRNRFVELHFGDIPVPELVNILHQRCGVAEKFCQRFVDVMHDLQKHRQGTRLFAGKHGFITLRDLFRWAERYKFAAALQQVVDHEQLLAEDGYILLAERVRQEDEKAVVVAVLSRHFKCTLDMAHMYSCADSPLFAKLVVQLPASRTDPTHPLYPFRNVVWTAAMKRLFTIVERAIRVRDPLLLVGETGCGKTTICQIVSVLLERPLQIVNCHEHTETSDFLGGLRPVRASGETEDSTMDTTGEAVVAEKSKSLFEWVDGPLVEAMRGGSMFLIDEISLADDSVLERINSVLEPARLLVLAERGGETLDEIIAADGFCLLATMNPGGDFGKKELSPALRNRFNEVWVPSVTDPVDLQVSRCDYFLM
jgi:midasin (ATPase involved in ribosome maturation)